MHKTATSELSPPKFVLVGVARARVKDRAVKASEWEGESEIAAQTAG